MNRKHTKILDALRTSERSVQGELTIVKEHQKREGDRMK